MVHVYSDDDKAGWIMSGVSAQGTATTAIDARATVGNFTVDWSASGNGPSGGASAIFTILHSPISGWWKTVSTITAAAAAGTSAQGHIMYTGYPGYLTCRVDKLYSAAMSGTGSVYIYFRSVYI